MTKFLLGFYTATVFFFLLLYFTKMPEYMTYDCRHLADYDDVPEHVIKACSRLEERDRIKWERI